MPSRVTASAMITCGSLSRPSLEWPRLLTDLGQSDLEKKGFSGS
jgi:hypothetical protein